MGATSDDGLGEPVKDTCARYKYQRLRDRLRAAVQSGELSGKLPGERELARRYDANAKTINKALCDLTTEGLLVRHVGRGTFVSGGAGVGSASRRKLMTYAWLSCAGANDTSTLLRQAEALIRERGHRLIALAVPPGAAGEISEVTVTPGQLRSWDGVILASPAGERLLADLHRRHLPCVMIQNTHERIKTSTVLPDYAQGAFELTQYLVHLGHEQIHLLIDFNLLPAACVAEAGYRAALLRNGLQPVAFSTVVEGGSLGSVLAGSDRPTAVICVGAALARRVVSEGLTTRSSTSSPLSVCAVIEAGQSGADGALCAYEFDAGAIAHWAVDVLFSASPGQSSRTIIVPGRFVAGASAAPLAGAARAETVARQPAQVDL